MLRCSLLAITTLFFADFVSASTPLPIVEAPDAEPLKANVQRLFESLQSLNTPLSKETAASANLLLQAEKSDPAVGEKLQKLLDPYCLIGVTINPESRVKAVRGPADAELVKGPKKIFLIKVQNDAGVTQKLQLYSPQLHLTENNPERWLRAVIHIKPPMRESLSGQQVEYLILTVSSSESGKREATLIFDVGQGTQDLGFRAEVPILFHIMK